MKMSAGTGSFGKPLLLPQQFPAVNGSDLPIPVGSCSQLRCHGLNRPLDVGGRDVQMRDRAGSSRAGVAHEDAAAASRREHSAAVAAPDRDGKKTRFVSTVSGSSRSRGSAACRRPTAGRWRGLRPGARRDGPGHTRPRRPARPPAACRRRAPCDAAAPRGSDRAGRPVPSRPGAEPLAEADAHRVEVPGPLGRGMPVATAAFQSRAPSRCVRRPCRRAQPQSASTFS